MTPTRCIHRVPHTHNVTNLHNTTPCKKPQTRPRHVTQWTFMSISPSDWSEEARPLMTINRHQTENNMREKAVKVLLHFTQKPWTPRTSNWMLPLQEWAWTYKEPMTLLGTSKCIYLIQGSFTFPCIPFFIPFISAICQQGFVQIEAQIQKPTSKRKSPSFSFTSQPHWAYPFTNP